MESNMNVEFFGNNKSCQDLFKKSNDDWMKKF